MGGSGIGGIGGIGGAMVDGEGLEVVGDLGVEGLGGGGGGDLVSESRWMAVTY